MLLLRLFYFNLLLEKISAHSEIEQFGRTWLPSGVHGNHSASAPPPQLFKQIPGSCVFSV